MTPEEQAELLHRDIVMLCGQTPHWWEFRRRRLVDQEIRANLEAIRGLQEATGRQLLH